MDEKSKRKPTQVSSIEENRRKITAILDCEDPFHDQVEVERIVLEFEEFLLSPLDLLYELWNSALSAMCNLRLILGSISKYMVNQRLIDPTTARMNKGCSFKITLMELHRLCLQKGQINPKCSLEEMHLFIRNQIPRWLYDNVVKGEMSKDTFDEWVKDHKEYIASLPGNSEGAFETLVIASEKGGNMERGLDALFDSAMTESNERIPQHVVKLDNGRLFTLKTPGEIGLQMIRLMVYDVKDISHKDKRNWWKYAKVRTQFLSSRNDRKQQLLRQLLDEAADDLKKVPGSIKEVRNIGDNGGVK